MGSGGWAVAGGGNRRAKAVEVAAIHSTYIYSITDYRISRARAAQSQTSNLKMLKNFDVVENAQRPTYKANKIPPRFDFLLFLAPRQ